MTRKRAKSASLQWSAPTTPPAQPVHPNNRTRRLTAEAQGRKQSLSFAHAAMLHEWRQSENPADQSHSCPDAFYGHERGAHMAAGAWKPDPRRRAHAAAIVSRRFHGDRHVRFIFP